MARTHDFPLKVFPMFFQFIRLTKEAPAVHIAKTTEIEHPHRVSSSLVLRLIGSHGIVLGWWKESGMEEWEALMSAIEGGTNVKAIDNDGRLNTLFRETESNAAADDL